MSTSTTDLFAAYTKLSNRWHAAKDIDAKFGTDYAADLVGPMRAAWAAYLASR